jgi:hypothetical protein
MSDRTQFAIGRNTLTMPRFTKRAIEVAMATGMTSLVAFVILLLNNVLTARGGWLNGFDIWLSFIRRPDILGTMVLTALVTVLFLQWYREGGPNKR